MGKAPRECWDRDRDNTPSTFKVPGDVGGTVAASWTTPTPQDVTFASRDPQTPNAKLAA